ncbi:MAG TPA: hypothetical protein VNX21_00410 [Candidatus Thermoplasmatota archaeon]|nr:hypothetical protein [Candidatus Thermoplasmatota archaeon]
MRLAAGLLEAVLRRNRDLAAPVLAVVAYAMVAALVPVTGRPGDPALAMVAVLLFALLGRRA